MAWNFTTDRPIYTQLIEQIERQVLSEEYLAGARLPGVREMAEIAGVNPNTMQRALTELEAKGLLYTQSTNGRFVVDDKQHIEKLRENLALSLSSNFLQDMKNIGCNSTMVNAYLEEAKKTT